MSEERSNQGFDAFISYRRSDGRRIARWLRAELQRFRLPRELRSPERRPLRIYLDTAYARATWDFYEGTLRPALLSSRYLLVLATPDAAQRPGPDTDWIRREIDDFIEHKGGERVFLVRAAGPLDGPLPGALHQRLARLEIVDLRGAGRLSGLNPLVAGRIANEKLKLLGPLMNIRPEEMPALRREEERRQQSRLGTAAGGVTAFVAGAVALSTLALTSKWAADEAIASSTFATQRLLLSVADNLPDEGGIGETRTNLLNEACDLMDGLSRAAAEPTSIRARVVCLLERAAGWREAGASEQAEALLAEAMAQAEKAHAQAPSSTTAYALLRILESRWAGAERAEARHVVFDRLARLAEEMVSFGLFARRAAEMGIEQAETTWEEDEASSLSYAERAHALTRQALNAGGAPSDNELWLWQASLALILASEGPSPSEPWIESLQAALRALEPEGSPPLPSDLEALAARVAAVRSQL